MQRVEFTVLDETEFIDRSDPQKPKEMVLVTFQTPDGRVDSIALPKAGYTKESRNKAIAERIKARKPFTPERVSV
jgi:hypothetical protein